MSSRKAPSRVNLLQPRRAVLTTLQPRRVQPRRVALLCPPVKQEKIIYLNDGEEYFDTGKNTRYICKPQGKKSHVISSKALTNMEYEDLVERVSSSRDPRRSDLDLLEKENKRRQAKRQDDIYSKWENIGDIDNDEIIDFGIEIAPKKKRRKSPKKKRKSPKNKSLRQLCLEKKKEGYIWAKGPDGYICRKKKSQGRHKKVVRSRSPKFVQWLSTRKKRWRELRKKRKGRKKSSFRMRKIRRSKKGKFSLSPYELRNHWYCKQCLNPDISSKKQCINCAQLAIAELKRSSHATNKRRYSDVASQALLRGEQLKSKGVFW